MCQELEHSRCTMTLIVPLNASAILCVFLWTWPPPKEPTENIGVNYCLLTSTETSLRTVETRLRITFQFRWEKFCRISYIKFTYFINYLNKIKTAALTKLFSLYIFFLQSPCSSSPCQDGGTCVPNYKLDTFECLCQKNFNGKYCDRGMNMVRGSTFQTIIGVVASLTLNQTLTCLNFR